MHFIVLARLIPLFFVNVNLLAYIDCNWIEKPPLYSNLFTPHTSFSLSSASRVLNFFCTSLISLYAVFRLEEGAEISPGSLVLELL